MSSRRFSVVAAANDTAHASFGAGQVMAAVARRLRPGDASLAQQLDGCLQIIADRLGWARVTLLVADEERRPRVIAHRPPRHVAGITGFDVEGAGRLLDAAAIAGCFVASRRDHRAGSTQDLALAAAGAQRDEVTAVVGALEGLAGAVLILHRPVDQPPLPVESIALEQVATLMGSAIERSEGIATRDETRALLDLIPDFVAVVDDSARLQYISGGVRTMLGHEPSAWLGRDISSGIHPDDRLRASASLQAALEGRVEGAREFRFRRATGEWRTVEVLFRALPEAPGMLQHPAGGDRPRAVLCVRDVDERRQLFDRVTWQATHDLLTGLLSRVGLGEQVRSRRGSSLRWVLRIDVEGFRGVNEYFGHEVGDEYLRVLAQRLRKVVGPNAEVGRVGGDDFVAVVDGDGDALAAEVREHLGAPVILDSASVENNVVVGIAGFLPGGDLHAVLADAESAVIAAKRSASGIVTFDETMSAQTLRRRALKASLRTAIDSGEGIGVAYQPVVRACDRATVGFEALARWRAPDGTAIPPNEFVPIAEATGLIRPLGRLVRALAVEEFAAWCRAEGQRESRLALNVSVAELEDPAWLPGMAELLSTHDFDPARVTVEITESIFMEDYAEVAARLNDVRALGCAVAIDDFGTGYSSFAHVDLLPVDVLKIDRSFIDRIATGDCRAERIVATIVQMASTLDLTVVAEGIEHERQARRLTEIGVDLMQGFWFGRPDALPDLLSSP